MATELDRISLEDALVEQIKAEATRLRRFRPPGLSEERAVRFLKADAEVVKAILRARQERMAVVEDEIKALKQRGGKASRRRPRGR